MVPAHFYSFYRTRSTPAVCDDPRHLRPRPPRARPRIFEECFRCDRLLPPRNFPKSSSQKAFRPGPVFGVLVHRVFCTTPGTKLTPLCLTNELCILEFSAEHSRPHQKSKNLSVFPFSATVYCQPCSRSSGSHFERSSHWDDLTGMLGRL